MPLVIQTIEQMAEFLPPCPAYTEADGRWVSLDTCRFCTELSESGLAKARRRLGRKFEHRDASGRVWIFFARWYELFHAARRGDIH
jgi:hypothetical protein